MDRNEQNLKIEELKTAMHNRDFDKAVEIADSLELKKIKDNNFLSLVADAYEVSNKYDEAKKVLLIAYENTNAGRQLAYRLCLISVKTKDFDEAREFYEDFVEMAPRDTTRYVLRYKIAKAQDAPIEKLIKILEEYVNIDMEEKWAYELAKLYHLAGNREKCVDMCNEISLWFSEGKYVAKAMELKGVHRPDEIEIQLSEEDEVSENVENETESHEELQEIEEDDIQEIEEFTDTSIKPASEPEQKATSEPIKDIQGVEDILRQLQARGILKAETVEQAVSIIDEAGQSNKSDFQDNISTFKRWEEDSAEPVEETSVDEMAEDTVHEPIDLVEKSDKTDEPAEADKTEKHDVTEEVDKTEEPVKAEKTVEIVKEPKVTAHTAEIKIEKKPIVNGVPVFDLDFETPQIDVTNDMANEAQKKAETEVVETAKTEYGTTEFRSDKQLSVNVEIISGTEWKQDETTKKQAENLIISKVDDKNVEVPVDKASTQKFDLTAKPENVVATNEYSVEKKEMHVLSDEELSTFKNYLNVEGFATNIKDVLQELIVNYTPNGKSTDGNVIIMGNEKTGKTTLAIETIKLVNKKRGRRNRKLAKIDAGALNRRGFKSSLNRLLGSDLIIENAHILGSMTLSEVIDATGMFTDDMLIVLEGETEQMEKMLSESTRLADVFNHVIRIREYDIKEWVEYGKRYAKEQGYRLDELANLAFYKTIDDFFGANKGIGQSDVETIVNDAIDRSRRLGRKLSGIFSSKKNEDGLYTLVETDFNIK